MDNAHSLIQATNLDPFWNIEYNFSALLQAANYKKTDQEMNLYKNLFPDITGLNGFRNVNFYPFPKLQDMLNRIEWIKKNMLTRTQIALNYTHKQFHLHQHLLIRQYLPTFEEYLIASCANENPEAQIETENKIKFTREKIQQFYRYTQPFFNAVLSQKNEQLSLIFKKHFCDSCYSHLSELQKCQDMIALQAEIDGKLPFKALLEASFGRLSEQGANELHAFGDKLVKNKVSVNVVHRALAALVEHFQKYHVSEADKRLMQLPNLGTLENYLAVKNESLYFQEDALHMQWIDSLRPGSIIASNLYLNEETGTRLIPFKFILGAQLGKKEMWNSTDVDHNIYFEIKECFPLDDLSDKNLKAHLIEKSVMWFTINEALPGIRLARMSKVWGLPSCHVHGIDKQGRFALLEKLHLSPLGPQGSIEENEKIYRQLLENWIRWLISEDFNGKKASTPFPLLPPQHLMLNQENRLTAVKLTEKMERFSYKPFEKFVFHASKGKPEAFKKMMKNSGLSDLAEAAFLRRCANSAFNPELFDAKKQYIAQKYQDKSILQLGLKVQKKINKVRDDCVKSICMNANFTMTQEKHKQLENLILRYYNQSEGACLLWPSMQAEVLEAFK